MAIKKRAPSTSSVGSTDDVAAAAQGKAKNRRRKKKKSSDQFFSCEESDEGEPVMAVAVAAVAAEKGHVESPKGGRRRGRGGVPKSYAEPPVNTKMRR